jgi:hypothetical protein
MRSATDFYPPLESGGMYHVYNRANSQFDRLFIRPANYHYFLKLFRRYLGPFAETFAYCLLPDHFHFLIRIREEGLIRDHLVQSVGYERYIEEPIPVLLSEVFPSIFHCLRQGFQQTMG